MKTAVVQTRVDAALKRDADAFFESIGMDTTTAIRIFLKQTLIQHKIPFEILQDDSFYSEKNMKALERSKAQMENGQHSIRELVEVQKMHKDFSDNAWADYTYWITQDKRILKKIHQLLADIERNGNDGIGHPEPLRGNFSSYWSRTIDEKTD